MNKTAQPLLDAWKKRGVDSPKVLVFGAAGFVGSQLSEALVGLGADVVGVDNLLTGSERYLKKLRDQKNFEFIEADILEELPNGLTKQQATHIVFAVDVYPHVGNKKYTLNEMLANSVGLKRVLELANKKSAAVVYTSSVDIYWGIASHEQVKKYYDGKELSTYYTFLEAKRYGESLCHEYVDSFGLDIRIARFPEIYGARMDIHNNSTLARALSLSLQGKDLVLDEEGSREHQLLYVTDAIYGLVKLLFAKEDSAAQGIFYFSNPERVSTLSVAYTLQELSDKSIKVEFIPQHRKVGMPKTKPVDIDRTRKLLNWEPKVDLTDGLKKTLDWFKKNPPVKQSKKEFVESTKEQKELGVESKEPEIEPSEQESSDEEKGQKIQESSDLSVPTVPIKGWLSLKYARKPWVLKKLKERSKFFQRDLGEIPTHTLGTVLGIVIFLLLTPLLLLFGFSGRAYWEFNQEDFEQAEVFFQQSEDLWEMYRAPLYILHLGEFHRAVKLTYGSGVYGSRFMSNLKKGGQTMVPLFDSLSASWRKQEQEGPALAERELGSTIQKARAYIREARVQFVLLEAKLSEVDARKLPGFLTPRIVRLQNQVRLAKPTINNTGFLFESLPALLGFDSSKRYLVLLQNNTELRATGGFIGSYAAFNLDQARLKEFKVDDIYNPDGQLSSHSDPSVPEALAKELGVKYLGIRDSNWWTSVPKSLKTVNKLYLRATKEKPDVIIAINLSLVKNLLKVTGPVNLPKYNEQVTAENVFQRAQVHAEVGFEPGSTQKKDFLGALSQGLLDKLFDLSAEKHSGLGAVLAKGLLSRNLVFYSPNPDLQGLFTRLGWAGELIKAEGDYLRVVDSNVGGNKANYWIKRKTKYDLNVDRYGQLQGSLRVTWTHTGENATWPGGDYKNYLRVYLPLGVQNVRIDPELKQTSVYQESQRTVVAGLVTVPVNTTQQVTVRYDLPKKFALTRDAEYSLVWENQPGITAEQTELSFNLPVFLSSQDPTSFSTTLTEPRFYHIDVDGTQTIETAPTPSE